MRRTAKNSHSPKWFALSLLAKKAYSVSFMSPQMVRFHSQRFALGQREFSRFALQPTRCMCNVRCTSSRSNCLLCPSLQIESIRCAHAYHLCIFSLYSWVLGHFLLTVQLRRGLMQGVYVVFVQITVIRTIIAGSCCSDLINSSEMHGGRQNS
jgi:hypothetical protein